MASIQALTIRNIETNECYGAVGIEESSTSVYFSFTVPSRLTDVTKKALSDKFELSRSGNENDFYIETEAYHLTGIYNEVIVSIENIEVI